MELATTNIRKTSPRRSKLSIDDLRGLLIPFGTIGEAVWSESMTLPHQHQKPFIEEALRVLAKQVENAFVHEGEYAIYKDNVPPVSFAEFVMGKQYLDRGHEIYPELCKIGDEMNNGTYEEAVITGGIGCGKTSLANYGIAYQVYKLSRYKNPHRVFGLADTDEIVFAVQSFSAGGPTKNAYDRLYNLIASAPYFRNEFPFDKDRTSEIIFENRLCIRTYSGSVTAAIGQNVFGGLLDEVNFMSIIEGSKQSADSGTFDQAQELYNTIRERRRSRFLLRGTLPGMMYLVSSKRYPGEFTDRKADEAKREIAENLKEGLPGKSKIYVFDKRVWEVKPKEFFTGEWFGVFLGDQSRKPRILKKDEEVSPRDKHLVMMVPEEFKSSFRNDILKAIRDIGGHSTYAINPFIIDPEPVKDCFGQIQSIFDREEIDYEKTTARTHPRKFKNLAMPRWVHLDLALTGDAAGVACGYVKRFVPVKRSETVVEYLPEIHYDFILRVMRPENGEIVFSRIRDTLIKLRALGLPIKWVSMDSFQSADTRQILASQGFVTGIRSVDTETLPYDMMKSALVDQRVKAPAHQKAMTEMVQLERNMITNKIDHPPHGSKDCADAMAGVLHGLTMRTEIWLQHGIPPGMIPPHLQMKSGS